MKLRALVLVMLVVLLPIAVKKVRPDECHALVARGWPLLLTDTFWALEGRESNGDQRGRAVLAPCPALDGRDDLARLASRACRATPTPGGSATSSSPRSAPRLQWLHTFSAGVDSPVFGDADRPGRAPDELLGRLGTSIARTVMMLLLALSRDLPGWFAAQQERRWEPQSYDEVIGQRMVVVGWGADRTGGGSVVRGARTRDHRGPSIGASATSPIESSRSIDWPSAARGADWVVLALPLDARTRGVLTPRRWQGCRPRPG